MNRRWVDYVLREGSEFGEFLADPERQRTPTLFVLGGGFDPRTTTALEWLISARGGDQLEIVRLGLPQGMAGGLEEAWAQYNHQRVEEVAVGTGVELFDIPWPHAADAPSAGLMVIRQLIEEGYFEKVEQVVVDISALPRAAYFPVLGGLLKLAHGGSFGGDIHAVVCDNPAVDDVMVYEGAEGGAALGGFADKLEEARSTQDHPIVWAPVVGPHSLAQLEALLDFLEPDEICPVLPFPAANPRRPDDLLLQYREFLFSEDVHVGSRNFIYGSESNPFDLYRSLGDLQSRYRQALAPLGPATVALSAHSSKLMSIGVLLAAYEHELPVVHVFPSRYYIVNDADVGALGAYDTLTDLWLAGEPYRG